METVILSNRLLSLRKELDNVKETIRTEVQRFAFTSAGNDRQRQRDVREPFMHTLLKERERFSRELRVSPYERKIPSRKKTDIPAKNILDVLERKKDLEILNFANRKLSKMYDQLQKTIENTFAIWKKQIPTDVLWVESIRKASFRGATVENSLINEVAERNRKVLMPIFNDIFYRLYETNQRMSPYTYMINAAKSANEAASLINNISDNQEYNAMSIVLKMFKLRGHDTFDSVLTYLRSNVDIPPAVSTNINTSDILGDLYVELFADRYRLYNAVNATGDINQNDPLNVLFIDYDRIKHQLVCEYVLLLFVVKKLLVGQSTRAKDVILNRLRRDYLKENVSALNVLQLLPGLFTILSRHDRLSGANYSTQLMIYLAELKATKKNKLSTRKIKERSDGVSKLLTKALLSYIDVTSPYSFNPTEHNTLFSSDTFLQHNLIDI